MKWQVGFFAGLVGALVVGLAGCGGAPVSQKIARVSGNVKLNGAPLVGATVTFQPLDAKGQNLPSSFGKTDDQGNYSLEVVTNGKQGAVVGEHAVRITHPDDDVAKAGGSSQDIEDAGTAAVRGQRKIPERYASGSQFKFTVTPDGATDADFELKSP